MIKTCRRKDATPSFGPIVGEFSIRSYHQTLADWISFKALQPVFVMREESRVAAGWLSSYLRSEPASVFLSTLAGFSFTKQPQFFTSRAEFFTKSLDFYYQGSSFLPSDPIFYYRETRFFHQGRSFFLPLSKI